MELQTSAKHSYLKYRVQNFAKSRTRIGKLKINIKVKVKQSRYRPGVS
jgi:hypothetical protein